MKCLPGSSPSFRLLTLQGSDGVRHKSRLESRLAHPFEISLTSVGLIEKTAANMDVTYRLLLISLLVAS
jgi:hypothetical protein